MGGRTRARQGVELSTSTRSKAMQCKAGLMIMRRARTTVKGTTDDDDDEAGSALPLPSAEVCLLNLTTPTCLVGNMSDVFCHVMIWYVMCCYGHAMFSYVRHALFCRALFCSILSCSSKGRVFCSVVSCRVLSCLSRARGGILGEHRGNLGSGGRGMQGGSGREVCL